MLSCYALTILSYYTKHATHSPYYHTTLKCGAHMLCCTLVLPRGHGMMLPLRCAMLRTRCAVMLRTRYAIMLRFRDAVTLPTPLAITLLNHYAATPT
eukprot:2258739-Rhodomonas_salina.5